MLFKLELAEKILRKEKTMTCRLKKPGDIAHLDPETGQITDITDANGRIRWRVGSTYAIQPGRGKKQIGRFRLLHISSLDVRNISIFEAHAEGFDSLLSFWWVWCDMHDPPGQNQSYKHLIHRPDERYDAWALTFELIEGENHDG